MTAGLFGDPLTVAKTVAMLVLGPGAFALGVTPLAFATRWRRPASLSPHHVHRHNRHHHHQHPGDAASDSCAVSLLLCFGGGVLLCTTLLHLEPEVRESVAALQRAGRLRHFELLADVLFCAGFFLMLVVDEVAHAVLRRCYGSGPRRTHCTASGEDAPRRPMSLHRWTASAPQGSPCSGADEDEEPPSASVSLTSFVETEQEQLRDSLQDPRETLRHDETTGSAGGGEDVEKQQQQQGTTAAAMTDDRGDHSSLRGLFAVLALSVHEVFEGLAVGLESRADHVWYLSAAVATHKMVIAFCVGLELAWSGTRRAVLVAYVAAFAAVTPIGIACGMAATCFGAGGDGTAATADESSGPMAVVLQGLAAGTLLYVVFFEVLARHRRSGWSCLAAMAVGFATLLALQIMTHHHHGHFNSHDNHDFGIIHCQGQDHEHGYGHHQDHPGHKHDHGN